MPGKKDARKQLVYIADPMCSWCWGFAPVMDRLGALAAGRADLRVIMGGLRPYTTATMDDAMRAYIRNHWQHVHERTGQPFNEAFFDRSDFVYDTEPACRAVVTARGFDRARTLAMLHALHRAFYAGNRDITASGTVQELAGELGFQPATFGEEFESDAVRAATNNDFQIARQTGATGFPTLLAGHEGETFRVVTRGYQDYDAIADRLDAWLAQSSPEDAPA